MEGVTHACRALLLLILIRSALTVGQPGIMQMQVEGFYNTHGRDSAGRCCSLPANTTARSPIWCPGNCRTFFRVCAAKVGPNWPDEPDLRQNTLACPLGLLVTPPVANNSLDPQQDGVLIMRFPYREWPGKVKIVLEAWHDVTGNLFTQDPRVQLGADNMARLIMRLERRHRLNLNEDWLRRTVHITVPNGESSRRPVRRISITYALRIIPIPKPTTLPFTVPVTTTEVAYKDVIDNLNKIPEAPIVQGNGETGASNISTAGIQINNTELVNHINLIDESEVDDEDGDFIRTTKVPNVTDLEISGTENTPTTQSSIIDGDYDITKAPKFNNTLQVTNNSSSNKTKPSDKVNSDAIIFPDSYKNSLKISKPSDEELVYSTEDVEEEMKSSTPFDLNLIRSGEILETTETTMDSVTETTTFESSITDNTLTPVELYDPSSNFTGTEYITTEYIPINEVTEVNTENTATDKIENIETTSEVFSSTPRQIEEESIPVNNNSVPSNVEKELPFLGSAKSNGHNIDTEITYIHGLKIKRKEDMEYDDTIHSQ